MKKLLAFKEAHPDEPVPRALLTYFDDSGVRRYTVSRHDARKSSLRAADAYAGSVSRARRNEVRLSIALQAVPMICFEWDIIEDKVRRFDPARLDLSPADSAIGHFNAVLEAVHSDDRDRFRLEIERTLATPEREFGTEVRVLNSDGSTRWYRERGRVERDAEGRPLRLIGVAVDITAEKSVLDSRRSEARSAESNAIPSTAAG